MILSPLLCHMGGIKSKSNKHDPVCVQVQCQVRQITFIAGTKLHVSYMWAYTCLCTMDIVNKKRYSAIFMYNNHYDTFYFIFF